MRESKRNNVEKKRRYVICDGVADPRANSV